jgi:hypothetical protein
LSFTFALLSPLKVSATLKILHHIYTRGIHFIHHSAVHHAAHPHHPAARHEKTRDASNNEQEDKNDEQYQQNVNKSLICDG